MHRHFNSYLIFRFKDEMMSALIIQFCGLRSKCYSIVSATDQKMAAAGVKKSSQKLLKHHLFVEALVDRSHFNIRQKNIISKKHEIYTQSSYKTALSCLDIKRIVLPDEINTVPYGYY